MINLRLNLEFMKKCSFSRVLKLKIGGKYIYLRKQSAWSEFKAKTHWLTKYILPKVMSSYLG